MTMLAGVAKGAAALGTTRMISNLVGVAGLIVLARLLTPEDYGIVAIGTTVLGIITAVTELSLGAALVQRAEVTREHIDTAWTMALLRALLITVVLGGLSVPLAWVYEDPRLVPVFIVCSLTGAIGGLRNPHIVLRTKQLQFRPLLLVQLSQKLGGVLVAVALALWLRSYWAMIVGTALGTLLSVLFGYVLIPYRPRFNLSRSRDLLRFSSWLLMGQLVTVLNWRFDQLLIGLFLPKAQLGAYFLADNISAIPTRESSAPITQALFPSFAALQAEPERLRSAYLRAQAALAIIALPAGFGLAILAEPIVLLALGEKWLVAAPLIQVIAGSYAIQALSAGSQPLAMADGSTRRLFFRNLSGLLLRAPLVTIGLIAWGMTGLLWARALSATIGLYFGFVLVRQIIGISVRDQIWSHRRTLLALVSMVAAVKLGEVALVAAGASPLVQLLLLVPAGGVTFVAVLALSWFLDGRQPGAETQLVALARRMLVNRVPVRS